MTTFLGKGCHSVYCACLVWAWVNSFPFGFEVGMWNLIEFYILIIVLLFTLFINVTSFWCPVE